VSARDWRQRLAARNNKTVFKSLTNSFNGLGKKTLGTGAAAALEAAMRKGITNHDSSRAAANWDVNIGGNNPYKRSTSELAPKYYASHRTEGAAIRSRYEIGERGDRGKNAGNMASRKRKRYGYTRAGGDENVKVREGSWIYNNLNIGKPGRPPVQLFNPIMGMIPPYAVRAFPGFDKFKTSVLSMIVSSAKPVVFEEVDRINKALRKNRGKIL